MSILIFFFFFSIGRKELEKENLPTIRNSVREREREGGRKRKRRKERKELNSLTFLQAGENLLHMVVDVDASEVISILVEVLFALFGFVVWRNFLLKKKTKYKKYKKKKKKHKKKIQKKYKKYKKKKYKKNTKKKKKKIDGSRYQLLPPKFDRMG